MAHFSSTQSLRDFQNFIDDVYSLPDDRLFSLWDLLTQQQRFTMRTLKGIRKEDADKVRYNLLISFSWLNAIANRLHIDLEKDAWKRFPALCSYCGSKPCTCKATKPESRKKVTADTSKKPTTLRELQTMFAEIYPPTERTLADAGVHLAEEMGEVSEAIHNFLGQHLQEQFDEIELEISDYVSCVFGVANSANIDVSAELEKMYANNCHQCHKKPCACGFDVVSKLKT